MGFHACLLTRNHAGSIGRAVASIRSVADRVVVGDTGSTDATEAEARSAGADVVAIPWADDFGAACNAVLDYADADWVFWLNPDEEIVDAAAIRTAIADETAFAYRLPVRQKLRPDSGDDGPLAWEERLFRRTAEVRYFGRVHPQFLTPLSQLATANGRQIKELGVTFVRHAYLSVPTPDKIRWVVRLLEAELKDRPDRLGVKIELGRNLLWLNDPRGHDLLAQAALTVLPYVRHPHAPDPAVGQLFEYILNADPNRVQTELDLDQVRKLVPKWFGRTPPVLWAAARDRHRVGDLAGAVRHLDSLLEIGQTGWHDSPGFDPDIVGVSAAMMLGACHLQLGNWMLARACFEHFREHSKHGELAKRGYYEADAKWRASRSQV